MSDYKHILLAVDVCGEYEALVEKALKIKGNDTRLSIIHVVEPVYYPESYVGGLTVDLQKKSIEFAQSELKELVRKHGLGEENQHIEVGSPARLIHQYAENNDVDLVVIGSHGKHGLQLILGSTATGVLHGAKCDVLAVRVYDD